METKLKRKGEVPWSGINVIFAGVQEMERDREGMDDLLNYLGVLGLEFSGLNTGFQGLVFV